MPSSTSMAQCNMFSYILKMINPSRMSEYKNVDIQGRGHSKSLSELKEFVTRNLPSTIDKPNLQEVEMGFIEPGHGGKGRKVWLLDDNDVQKMYEVHLHKKQVLLWCYTHVSTQKNYQNKSSENVSKVSSAYATQLKKQDEITTIFSKLKEKHEGKYKTEQLHTWAHMIYLKTHDSLDNPPDKPFFTRKRSVVQENIQPTVPKKPTSGGSISPGRRVNIRSELIDQLKKCQDLIDSGAISKEVFDELQITILADIKKL